VLSMLKIVLLGIKIEAEPPFGVSVVDFSTIVHTSAMFFTRSIIRCRKQ
jgi:hypothetical protein